MTARVATEASRAVMAVRGLDRGLGLLAVMAFVTQIGVAVMLPLLPLYATQFGATPLVLGLLTSAHAITSAIGQLAGGFLSERFAARRLVAFGIGLYAGANVLIATAAAALPLILFRGLAGLGGGVNQVSERIYLTQVTDQARRAFSNGILSAAGAAGSVLGPAFGGLLVVVAGGDLRVPFLLVGFTSTLATIAAFFLPRPPTPTSAVPDGSDMEPDSNADSERVEPTTDGPPRATFTAAPAAEASRRPIFALFFANLALMAGFGAFITTYAIYATGTLGWSTVDVGIAFSMFGLGSVLLGPWLARLADRTGRRRMAIVGSIPVVGFGLLFAAGAPQPVIYAAAIVGGGGLTAFESAWYALLAAATEEGRRGRVFGIVTALTNLGVVVGALVAARAWESVDIQLAVVLAAIVFALAGLAMLAHPRDRIMTPVAAVG